MAIVDAYKIGETVTQSRDGIGATEEWRVTTDGTETKWTLIANTNQSLPKYGTVSGSYYVADVAIDLTNAPDPTEWTYTVTWAKFKAGQSDADPLNEPAQIDWGGSMTTESVYFDIDNKAITNSAGEDFAEQPQREVGNGAVTITKNQSGNPAANIRTYSNTINSGDWYGVPAYVAKMGQITGSKQYAADGTAYWRVSFPIVFNTNTWRLKTYDYTETEIKEGKRVAILDAAGQPVRVKLNGSGSPLEDQSADPVIYPAEGWKLYKKTDWGNLSLPNPFA